MPEELLKEIDRLVGKRKRSQFVTQATRKELNRLKLERALDNAAGAWSDDRHKELVQKGTYGWIRELRGLDLERLERKSEPEAKSRVKRGQ
jgi:hypothetical protein